MSEPVRTLFRRYLLPKTLEQSIGATMVFAAAVFILRPFAAGLEDLYLNYGVVVTVQAFGSVTAVFGAALILLKRVERRTFALLFSPIPVYTICLFLYFLRNPRVGGLGWIGYLALTLALSWAYSSRLLRRESELT